MNQITPQTPIVTLTAQDWETRYQLDQAYRADNLARMREELRLELLKQALFMDGETSVELSYEGSGDSGGMEECNVDDPRVQDLLMEQMDQLHGGWEINDGGRGTITWDLRSDIITVEHSQFYMSSEDSSHELEPGPYKTPSAPLESL